MGMMNSSSVEYRRAYARQYYLAHLDDLRARARKRSKENVDVVRIDNSPPVICACGNQFKKASLIMHLKSQKHRRYIESLVSTGARA